MSYTNFNMRLDDNLRAKAYPVLEHYGLMPSQAVRMFFNQIAHTGQVPLSFDWASNLNTSGEKMLRESMDDIQNGRYSVHRADELIDRIDEIAHE